MTTTQLLVELSEKVGGVTGKIDSVLTRFDKLEAHILENFADKKDLKNLGDMYRNLDADFKAYKETTELRLVELEEKPDKEAAATLNKLKNNLWKIAWTLVTAALLSAGGWIWYALSAGAKAGGGTP